MREIRSSGSAEGVIGNCDPYSDSPKPLVVKQPKSTRVKEPTLLCNQVGTKPTDPGLRLPGLRRPDKPRQMPLGLFPVDG